MKMSIAMRVFLLWNKGTGCTCNLHPLSVMALTRVTKVTRFLHGGRLKADVDVSLVDEDLPMCRCLRSRTFERKFDELKVNF